MQLYLSIPIITVSNFKQILRGQIKMVFGSIFEPNTI